ncbi:MAG: anti-anti-sigma factor [Microbacteriaceae bacterium]|jgi:anti-sigma B factor antagonist|nr:anti-anti-sigma factor [Microbacteriaceae bacterium]
MDFAIQNVDELVAVIRGEGRLNMVSAPDLRTAVAEAVAAGRPRVVVDLSGVEFMDSSGLGALVGCLKTTRQAGGDLRIAAPSDQVTMVLKLSNLDRILTSYATPTDAYRE